jgi:hypothetical protein
MTPRHDEDEMEFMEDEAFGELRALLQGAPSLARFARICRAAQRMEEASPGLFASRYADYTRATLDAWPRHRRTLRAGGDAEHVPGLAWAPLVRALHVEVGRFEELSDVLARFDGLEHLGMRGSVSQKPLLAAIDDGLFDGLRSIEFDGMPLRTATFEAIIGRLSEREGCAGLEELRFTGCNIKKAHVEALCQTPLPERLRTLGLTHNTSLKTTGVQAITSIAGRFVRLERLELARADLKAPAAKAIATAGWANALEHVDLSGNPLKAQAFKTLDAAGMLPALVDRQGAPALDVSGWLTDAKTLRLLLDRGLFDGLDTLRCWDSYGSGGWEVLVDEVERFAGLKELDSSAPQLHGDLIEPLLRAAELERLRLYGGDSCLDEDAYVAMLREQTALEHLILSWNSMTDDYGEEGVEAMMGWERWGEVDEWSVPFRVREGSAIHKKAIAADHFRSDHQNTAMGPRFHSSPGGTDWESSNHCVHLDGRISRPWMWRNVRNKGG